jgi:hypothetical protein
MWFAWELASAILFAFAFGLTVGSLCAQRDPEVAPP